jgi:hypothetical protein
MAACELSKSTDGKILIGGRDVEKGKGLAAEFDSRASAAHLEKERMLPHQQEIEDRGLSFMVSEEAPF